MGALAAGLLTASRPAAYLTWSSERDAPMLSAVTHARRRAVWALGPEAFLGADRQSQRLAGTISSRPRKSHEGPEKLEGTLRRYRPPLLTRAAAMEPRRSKRIKLSKEGEFGVLLGALMRDVPDLFEAEVLSKLDVKDHFRLAQVNKACRDVVYKLGPVEFMRSCDVSDEVDRLRSGRQVACVEGRLDVLKWLWKDNGPYHLLALLSTADFCGWIQTDIYYAGLHGHRHVLDWYLGFPPRHPWRARGQPLQVGCPRLRLEEGLGSRCHPRLGQELLHRHLRRRNLQQEQASSRADPRAALREHPGGVRHRWLQSAHPHQDRPRGFGE